MQNKIKTLFVLGVLVFVVPFLGIPFEARKWTLAVLGLLVILVTWQIKKQSPQVSVERKEPVYVENGRETTPEHSGQ